MMGSPFFGVAKLFLTPINSIASALASSVMCGVMDKATVGEGKKDNIFYVMLRDFGAAAAAEGMNRLSKLSARWFSNMGFSIGITTRLLPADGPY